MNYFNELLNMIMGGANPVQLLMSILAKNMPNDTPMYNNLSNLTQKQDERGLLEFAKNLAEAKGLNFEEAFNNFKRGLGI